MEAATQVTFLQLFANTLLAMFRIFRAALTSQDFSSDTGTKFRKTQNREKIPLKLKHYYAKLLFSIRGYFKSTSLILKGACHKIEISEERS